MINLFIGSIKSTMLRNILFFWLNGSQSRSWQFRWAQLILTNRLGIIPALYSVSSLHLFTPALYSVTSLHLFTPPLYLLFTCILFMHLTFHLHCWRIYLRWCHVALKRSTLSADCRHVAPHAFPFDKIIIIKCWFGERIRSFHIFVIELNKRFG